jgi:formamidopyrimidine-DNA glycosylase
MPELPEVEVLARQLGPLLANKTIAGVQVRRSTVLHSRSPEKFRRAVLGARFVGLVRRGKYLVFTLRRPSDRGAFPLLGHLGMTGRMYLQPAAAPLAKHAVVVFLLGRMSFVFEDMRCFGRLSLDPGALRTLGPEPLSGDFTVDYFARALKRSAQPIKVKLLDQSLVAGVGNIYASEALFRAGIPPRLSARGLTRAQTERLWRRVRETLTDAIEFGSAVSLDWSGTETQDGLFYYGGSVGASESYEERLMVDDRAGCPCFVCETRIRRIVQAARSTFYCPRCQQPGARLLPPEAMGW